MKDVEKLKQVILTVIVCLGVLGGFLLRKHPMDGYTIVYFVAIAVCCGMLISLSINQINNKK